jgi:hypothetical protein
MLLKTHVEKMSALGLAKISMKIKDIDCFCQDVYEKKGGWLKPHVARRDGGHASRTDGVCGVVRPKMKRQSSNAQQVNPCFAPRYRWRMLDPGDAPPRKMLKNNVRSRNVVEIKWSPNF